MNATIDVLQFMLPSADFSRKFHLASSQSGVNPMFTVHRPLDSKIGWIYYCKSVKGYPWDINYYDQNLVYQCITEAEGGWDDPTSYKVFACKSWPHNHGGIAWSARYLNPLPYTQFLMSASDYKRYKKGNLEAEQHLGGPTVCLVQGPYSLAIGKLGTQNCLLQTYQWGNGLHSMEENVYAEHYGWVRWRLFGLRDGTYELKQDSTFDVQTTGGAPDPVFPNPLP